MYAISGRKQRGIKHVVKETGIHLQAVLGVIRTNKRLQWIAYEQGHNWTYKAKGRRMSLILNPEFDDSYDNRQSRVEYFK